MNTNDFWALFFIMMLIDAAIGAFIDKLKNGTHRGFWLGILIGPIGLLIAAILPGNPRPEDRYKDEDGVFSSTR